MLLPIVLLQMVIDSFIFRWLIYCLLVRVPDG